MPLQKHKYFPCFPHFPWELWAAQSLLGSVKEKKIYIYIYILGPAVIGD